VRLTICLPTYNERDNLEPLLRALAGVIAEHGLDADVLVVDDDSPDGTGKLADELARALPFVSVLHRRRKEGLGPAYLEAFRTALSGDAELVLTMDCDFSHDPNDVPRLVQAADHADVVIGSRYVSGGGVRNWGPLRRVVSRGGCLYARLVLGVGVHDLTGGFKCYHRRVLEELRPERISSKGYAFQIETTYRALRSGFRVMEIPIVFVDREAGRSKMSRGIVLEAIVRVPALRLRAALARL
jgi:dolichol-phosphate mannosyltransferase